MATFQVPYVTSNTSSWGPPPKNKSSDDAAAAASSPAAASAPVSRFAQLPYAPFGRSDRLGRCADFTSSAYARTGDATPGYFRGRTFRNDANKNLEFQYRVDSEEAKEFQLVDSSNPRGGGAQGGAGGPKRFVPQARRRAQNAARLRQLNARRDTASNAVGRYNQPQRTRAGAGRGGRGGRGLGAGGRGGGGFFRDRIDRQASVSVRPDWRRVEDIDLGKLSKGTSQFSGLVDNTPPKSVEDLVFAGFLDQYNDQYDKVSIRTPAPLKRVETKEFYPVTTTDDPVIEKLAIEGKGTVFATDAILAHLMTCPRSVYPWDIVVQKLPNGDLFFDKRDASQFDYLTVHETSNTPPVPLGNRDNNEEDQINTPERLSLEATMINQNFTQQILRSSKFRSSFDLPNPFWDEEDNDGMEPASVAYRYRKFDLGDGVQLVARTELHGLAKDNKKVDTSKIALPGKKKKKKQPESSTAEEEQQGDQYMTAYALNEYDPSYASNAPPARPGTTINWREKLDNQPGAVLASELKNNSFKLAKWTAQSLLAGASQMKIGFVSRINPKNAYEHSILATQTYRPHDFASQMTLNEGTMWGIFRLFVKLLLDQPEGKYVIMRDPNRAVVRIYGVPMETFEESDEEDEEEGSDEEEVQGEVEE